MNPEQLIEHYGAAAVFLGGMVGGPILVTLGGYFAHDHLIPLWLCFFSALLGSLLSNQVLFLAGRGFASHPAVLRASDRPAAKAALRFIGRHPVSYIFLYRFVMGIRSISPLVLGVSNNMGAARFAILNLIGAAIWSGAFTGLGYLSGDALAAVVARTQWTDRGLILSVIAVVACLVAWRLLRRKSRGRAEQGEPHLPSTENASRTLFDQPPPPEPL